MTHATENRAASETVTGWVVSHTHWDREWYWPFQSFRRRLVKVVDAVLDILEADPEYRCFTLDGQTIVLEDYLAIRPENRPRLEALVRAGRLFVGPWYVLPDEFLVSGEALARNLLLGGQVARAFGGRMNAGYVPDPFGHVAQLPQILQNFGLDSCIFCRGPGEEHAGLKTEFTWRALDNTPVLAVFQRHNYCNLAALGYSRWWQESGADPDKAADQIENAIDALRDIAATDVVLLNNGCDHHMPQRELPRLLRHARERLDGVELVHGSFEGFVAAVRARARNLGSYQGELRWGKYILILPGVWSSRIYLKQANERVQTALEHYAEPAGAVAWLLGRRYETDFLTQAWKTLISNHPHDSICGCSVDAVHRAMMPRFEEAGHIADDVRQDSMDYLARRVDTTRPGGTPENADPRVYRALLAFNGLGRPYSGALKARLDIPVAAGGVGTGGLPRFLRVRDAQGRVVPSQVTRQRMHESFAQHAPDALVWQVDLEWMGEAPACGHTVFHVEEARPGYGRPEDTDLAYELDRMSNAHLSVVFQPNGAFHVYREDWPFYVQAGVFEDTEDAGDTYNYSPAPTSKTVTSQGVGATISQVAAGPVRTAYEIRQTLRVPASLTPDRMARSEDMVDLCIVSTVSLEAGARRVEVETRVTNAAKDHRLRALFETAERPDAVYADTAFGVVRRPIHVPVTEGWEEDPVGTGAMLRWFAVEGAVDDEGADDGRPAPQTGVAIIAQGLPEYEAMRGESSTVLALTLLRGVGWMSRGGAIARPYSAGPRMPAPDAQCPGEYVFHYAICPYEGTWSDVPVPHEALSFVAPPATVWAEETSGEAPPTCGYLTLEPAALVLSAVKRADDRDALIVRVVNPTDTARAARITFHAAPSNVAAVHMDETTPDERVGLQVSGAEARFAVPPFRVVTLAATFPGVENGPVDEETAVPRWM